jgi:hypothetical protein
MNLVPGKNPPTEPIAKEEANPETGEAQQLQLTHNHFFSRLFQNVWRESAARLGLLNSDRELCMPPRRVLSAMACLQQLPS